MDKKKLTKEERIAKKKRKRLKRERREAKAKEEAKWEGQVNEDKKESMVEDVWIKYKCRCGNRKWIIYSDYVKCSKCKAVYATINQMSAEFNRKVKRGLNWVKY